MQEPFIRQASTMVGISPLFPLSGEESYFSSTQSEISSDVEERGWNSLQHNWHGPCTDHGEVTQCRRIFPLSGHGRSPLPARIQPRHAKRRLAIAPAPRNAAREKSCRTRRSSKKTGRKTRRKEPSNTNAIQCYEGDAHQTAPLLEQGQRPKSTRGHPQGNNQPLLPMNSATGSVVDALETPSSWYQAVLRFPALHSAACVSEQVSETEYAPHVCYIGLERCSTDDGGTCDEVSESCTLAKPLRPILQASPVIQLLAETVAEVELDGTALVRLHPLRLAQGDAGRTLLQDELSSAPLNQENGGLQERGKDNTVGKTAIHHCFDVGVWKAFFQLVTSGTTVWGGPSLFRQNVLQKVGGRKVPTNGGIGVTSVPGPASHAVECLMQNSLWALDAGKSALLWIQAMAGSMCGLEKPRKHKTYAIEHGCDSVLASLEKNSRLQHELAFVGTLVLEGWTVLKKIFSFLHIQENEDITVNTDILTDLLADLDHGLICARRVVVLTGHDTLAPQYVGQVCHSGLNREAENRRLLSLQRRATVEFSAIHRLVDQVKEKVEKIREHLLQSSGPRIFGTQGLPAAGQTLLDVQHRLEQSPFSWTMDLAAQVLLLGFFLEAAEAMHIALIFTAAKLARVERLTAFYSIPTLLMKLFVQLPSQTQRDFFDSLLLVSTPIHEETALEMRDFTLFKRSQRHKKKPHVKWADQECTSTEWSLNNNRENWPAKSHKKKKYSQFGHKTYRPGAASMLTICSNNKAENPVFPVSESQINVSQHCPLQTKSDSSTSETESAEIELGEENGEEKSDEAEHEEGTNFGEAFCDKTLEEEEARLLCEARRIRSLLSDAEKTHNMLLKKATTDEAGKSINTLQRHGSGGVTGKHSEPCRSAPVCDRSSARNKNNSSPKSGSRSSNVVTQGLNPPFTWSLQQKLSHERPMRSNKGHVDDSFDSQQNLRKIRPNTEASAQQRLIKNLRMEVAALKVQKRIEEHKRLMLIAERQKEREKENKQNQKTLASNTRTALPCVQHQQNTLGAKAGATVGTRRPAPPLHTQQGPETRSTASGGTKERKAQSSSTSPEEYRLHRSPQASRFAQQNGGTTGLAVSFRTAAQKMHESKECKDRFSLSANPVNTPRTALRVLRKSSVDSKMKVSCLNTENREITTSASRPKPQCVRQLALSAVHKHPESQPQVEASRDSGHETTVDVARPAWRHQTTVLYEPGLVTHPPLQEERFPLMRAPDDIDVFLQKLGLGPTVGPFFNLPLSQPSMTNICTGVPVQAVCGSNNSPAAASTAGTFLSQHVPLSFEMSPASPLSASEWSGTPSDFNQTQACFANNSVYTLTTQASITPKLTLFNNAPDNKTFSHQVPKNENAEFTPHRYSAVKTGNDPIVLCNNPPEPYSPLQRQHDKVYAAITSCGGQEHLQSNTRTVSHSSSNEPSMAFSVSDNPPQILENTPHYKQEVTNFPHQVLSIERAKHSFIQKPFDSHLTTPLRGLLGAPIGYTKEMSEPHSARSNKGVTPPWGRKGFANSQIETTNQQNQRRVSIACRTADAFCEIPLIPRHPSISTVATSAEDTGSVSNCRQVLSTVNSAEESPLKLPDIRNKISVVKTLESSCHMASTPTENNETPLPVSELPSVVLNGTIRGNILEELHGLLRRYAEAPSSSCRKNIQGRNSPRDSEPQSSQREPQKTNRPPLVSNTTLNHTSEQGKEETPHREPLTRLTYARKTTLQHQRDKARRVKSEEIVTEVTKKRNDSSENKPSTTRGQQDRQCAETLTSTKTNNVLGSALPQANSAKNGVSDNDPPDKGSTDRGVRPTKERGIRVPSRHVVLRLSPEEERVHREAVRLRKQQFQLQERARFLNDFISQTHKHGQKCVALDMTHPDVIVLAPNKREHLDLCKELQTPASGSDEEETSKKLSLCGENEKQQTVVPYCTQKPALYIDDMKDEDVAFDRYIEECSVL